MRTARQTKIRRALLDALAAIGAYLMPDDLLRIEAARSVLPPPTTAELDAEVSAADRDRLMVGVQGEAGVKWKISDAGRAWRVENP